MSFNVNTQDGCAWNANTFNPWITLTGATSGSGGGTVSYAVEANTGPARSGAIPTASPRSTAVAAVAVAAVEAVEAAVAAAVVTQPPPSGRGPSVSAPGSS